VLRIIPAAGTLLAGYLVAVVLGQYLVSWVLAKAGMAQRDSAPSRLIGWFERFLIVTLVLVDALTAVGFVIAAKSILRFGESREDREFAQYVILGTLASASVAVAVGLGARMLLRLI